MSSSVFILLSMIFLHVIDDFVLQQGVLSNMKQRKWWMIQKEYDDIYKYDYIPALILHAFSWSFMIMLPIAISLRFDVGWWVIAYVINIIIHSLVDNFKANAFKINLVIDQTIHVAQIVLTWVVFICR